MRYLLLLFLALLAAGCDAASIPTLVADSAATASPAPPVDAWRPLSAGIEILETSDGLVALRHSPAAVDYEIEFEPVADNARTVGDWLDAASDADAAINCGFYRDDTELLQHLGLLAANDAVVSAMRPRWGGVLIVRDGVAAITPRPERLRAPATFGVQGWPMLVNSGGQVPGLDQEDLSRRTAVGVDTAGRVVWVASPWPASLDAFADRLLDPDLGLVDAVNLDGGSSTGLRWRAETGGQAGPDSLPIPCAVLLSSPGEQPS